jgi:hypothetical protein
MKGKKKPNILPECVLPCVRHVEEAVLLCVVMFQLLIQGHRIFGHTLRTEDPIMFFSGSIFLASMLGLRGSG